MPEGFKISTYEQSSAQSSEPIVPAPIQNTVIEEKPIAETPVIETPAAEKSETVVNNNGELKTVPDEKPKEEVKVETTEIEENTSNFVMPDFGGEKPSENGEVKPPAPETVNWKDVIKSVDRKEILKELGVDEFEINLHEHRQKGGKAEDYFVAKAVDWNKVSDRDMALQSLKNDYPNLDETDIKELFEDTYKQGEFEEDDAKRKGAIKMKADAYKMRQAAIQKQEQFKFPEQTKPNEIDPEQAQLTQQQRDNTIKFFTQHEATQNLINSKRVAINLGEGIKPFNFNIDKPEALVKPMVDSEAWQRVIATNPGEPDKTKLIPDVQKLQRIILAALNPNYERDIYNAGKSAGEKGFVDEGKNAKIPTNKPNVPVKESFKDKWKNPKISTYGAPA